MTKSTPESYWAARKNILYYDVVRILVTELAKGARSLVDVGTAGAPYLEWFSFIDDRLSIDLRHPYEGPGVRAVTSDFLAWQPDKYYDVVTCLQTLEHVPDAEGFAQKLLRLGEIVVISVPYKWPKGKTKSHVHDPVDEEKLFSWFGREPNYQYICREVIAPVERIIQVYEPHDRSWEGLNRRQARS